MPEETEWARFKRDVSAEQRDELAYRMHQWESRIGTHGPGCYECGPGHYACALREIEQLRNAAWKLGDALQDEQKKTVKLNAETIKLRGLLRGLIRTTVAHHQSPNDQIISAAYVAARDAAIAAIVMEDSNE